MNALHPCEPRICGQMEPEEADALDVLLHLLNLDLVVEIGSFTGESSRLFSRHCRCVTMDREEKAFSHALCVQGTSPEHLDRLLPHIVGTPRWGLFHDSDHYADTFVAEAVWAFQHGAAVVFWHDFGFVGPDAAKRGTMMSGAQRLQELGYRVVRVLDCGRPESNEHSTGIGIAYNK